MAFFDFLKRKPQPAATLAPATPPAPVAAVEAVPPEFADELIHDDAPLPTDHGAPDRRMDHRRNARPGTRVLVIDDSATIVALLKRMLKQNRYEVLEAFDAESGIEIARREVPGLIFLDIVLPGMDGFNALRTLRRDPVTKDVPIIMISGNAQATEQFYVQRIGADDFMRKPFTRTEVFDRIEALLDENDIPRHGAKPATRAAAAALAAEASGG